MTDPETRPVEEVAYVIVRRVIEKRVPDYEAALLCRHGWELIGLAETGENA